MIYHKIYSYLDKILILTIFLLIVSLSEKIMAQEHEVEGTVVSVSVNEPLIGVNIYEKDTTTGTVSDLDGNFSITVSNPDAILVFSYVGYLTEEIEIDGRSTLNIALREDALILDEIVAIGYGVMRKSDLTGSVHSVRSEDFESGALSSIDKKLSGRIPGVDVTQISGQPGSGTSIRIRGVNSILGNNEPLFVIDGVPYGSEAGYDINPNDIESIEVLKDASSTAIYGSRGANGVILITTKQGQEGPVNVSLDVYSGINTIDNKIELLNAEELAQVHRNAIANGVTQAYDPDLVTGEGTNWQDELYRTAPVQNYQLNISGGTESTQYMISGNYLSEDGIVKNSGFRRYALRSNLTTNISDRLMVIGNLYISRSFSDVPLPGVVGAALQANPIYPVKDETGRYLIYTDPHDRTMNPVASAELPIRKRIRYRVLPNVSGIYEILDNLTLNVNLGANITHNKSDDFFPRTTLQGLQNNGSANINYSNQFYWVNTNTLTFDQTFDNDHSLNALVGFTAEKQRVEQFFAGSNDFLTDFQEYHSLQSGANQFVNSSLNEYQIASFLSRVNYNIQDRYLFTLSGRYDGSSRFGRENQWAFFPSVAFAWRISNEDFLRDNDVIYDLKLRSSFGISGEQAIPSYQTLPSLSSTSALFANNTYRIGFIPSRLANPALKWEKTQQFNIGLDAGLFDGRISITADYYNKKTNDLLYPIAIPQTSGYTSMLSNVGSIGNKGFEFYIKSFITQRSAVQWVMDFNLGFNRNEILDLGTNPDGSPITRIVSPEGAVGGYGYLPAQNALVLGKPIGGAYGWIYEGTYKSQEEIDAGPEPHKSPGDPRYKDLNGDGVIDIDDRTLISNPNPKFTGGFTNSFSYKGFDLSVFLQFAYGHELYNYNHFQLSYMDGINNSQPWALNSWSEDNRDSDIPRAGWDNRTNGISTFHVEDASYLRARNITLGYTLPADRLMWNVNKVRVYISVDNAFTITNYSGYSPDVSAFGRSAISSGFDDSVYPVSKTFLLGFNFEF